jgi:D-alanyl-D-alanine carboxypeptidase
MTNGEHTREVPRIRSPRLRVVGLLLATAVVIPAVGCQLPAPSSPAASVPVSVLGGGHPGAPGKPARAISAPAMPREDRGALGRAGGAVPSGTTVFDDDVPGVAKLDPALLAALRRAATVAADDGVVFIVGSGWRSPAYQERLLDAAVSTYGSRKEAARWVAPPDRSAHVSGDAVDLGRSGARWLAANGAGFGLCQIYRNESWHFESRPDAVAHGCPAMYADAAHDPRMQP